MSKAEDIQERSEKDLMPAAVDGAALANAENTKPLAADIVSGELVPRERRLAGIHGLRGVAALMVIAPHATLALTAERTVSDRMWEAISITGFGVQLFFILSAFSLLHSTRVSEEGLAEYVIKRFFRIAPLFFAVVLFQQLRDGWAPLPANIINLTLIFGIVHGAFGSLISGGWSVGVEVTFYAVLPLVLLVCKSRRGYAILAVIGTIASWAAYRYVYDADPVAASSIFTNIPDFTFPGNIVTFCYGLLAYSIFREIKQPKRVAAIAAGIAGVALVALLLTPLWGQLRTPDRPGAFVLFALMASVTLWQALRPSWLMSNPVMQYIGARSYSLYLVQFGVIFAMRPVYHWIATTGGLTNSLTLVAFYLVTVPPVLVLASITYRFIEVPGVNLGRRIIAARRARAAMAEPRNRGS